MENKGLNIFNDRLVLASAETATDATYFNIDRVIAHEYFHNWTGNRITCRDWFQLCLKEGLTVFRDQLYSADFRSPAVQRISEVRNLKAGQFPEDAGPLAHPVRPDRFIEINNFYTMTVYEKGAELCRMIHTLLGADGFRKGMDLYFERHDGEAATVEDFIAAFADSSGRDFTQFMIWYGQAGTPGLVCDLKYNAQKKTAELTIEQVLAPTPGQPTKKPLHIPVRLGLLGGNGNDLPLELANGATIAGGMIELSKRKETFRLANIPARPVLSLLRGFSAPVLLADGLGDADLLVLLRHDSDPFNRWEAGQRLALGRLLATLKAVGEPRPLDADLLEAMRELLRSPTLDPAFKELALTLPSEVYIAEQLDSVDPQRVHAARQAMRIELAQALRADWEWAFDAHQVKGGYSPDPEPSGRRALANLALAMLCLDATQRADAVWPGRAYQRFKDATHMTDRQGALAALLGAGSELADAALDRFHEIFKADPLVVDTWFRMQATAPERDGRVFGRVQALLRHADFSLANPNRARSLIAAFCMGNPAGFHRPDGAGYAFWVERVLEIDAINPQLASRLARALERWTKLAEPYRSIAREAVARVAAADRLSDDTGEIVSRALAAG